VGTGKHWLATTAEGPVNSSRLVVVMEEDAVLTLVALAVPLATAPGGRRMPLSKVHNPFTNAVGARVSLGTGSGTKLCV
jgi:hypothetical protein